MNLAMDESTNNTSTPLSPLRRRIAIAATINLVVWGALLIFSVANVFATPVGAYGDPDATDQRVYAMLGCAPVFFIAAVSAFIWPFAARWRGRRLAIAIAAAIGACLLVFLAAYIAAG